VRLLQQRRSIVPLQMPRNLPTSHQKELNIHSATQHMGQLMPGLDG
jgi:hypothetical protein